MKNPELVQVNFFKFLIGEFDQRGGNARRCIKASDLNLFNLDDTNAYVPLNCMYRLFDEMDKETGTEDFISFFHHSIKVQNLHNYGSFMLSAPDVMSAAKLAIQYAPYNFTSEQDGLVIDGPRSKFWINLKDKYQPGKKHAYELLLSFIIDHIRLACGDNWEPIEIHYPMKKLPNLDALLPSGHQVRSKANQDSIAVIFPTSILNQSIRYNYSEQFNPFPLASLSLKYKLRQLLNSFRGGAIPTLEYSASLLNISVRSLQRKLRQEQSSYFQVVDEWRFSRAVELLEVSNLNIYEISQTLGYQKSESFHRSFRRWTGTTPQQYRDQL